jgi:hypothetical protein
LANTIKNVPCISWLFPSRHQYDFVLLPAGRQGGSCESLNNGERKRSSSLSCSSDFLTEETSATCPRVPTLVSVCFSHLEAYGLNTLGIFRVSSSKKRVRQVNLKKIQLKAIT